MKKSLWNRWAVAGIAAVAAAALVGAACGGGTSSSDKTATAGAGAAPTTAPTKAAAATPTAAATAAATKAATTPTAAATAAATSAATTPEASGAGGIKTGTTALGTVLTDGAGKTLYVFDNDTTAGTSACNGGCASAWPPAATTSTTAPTVAGATGTFTVITRDDGTMQIAYNGKPLYHYAGDSAVGDTTGDGVNGLWHAAKP